MDILGVIDKTIGFAKQAMTIAEKLKNPELKSVIVDLQLHLADLQEEFVFLGGKTLEIIPKHSPELKHVYLPAEEKRRVCPNCHRNFDLTR